MKKILRPWAYISVLWNMRQFLYSFPIINNLSSNTEYYSILIPHTVFVSPPNSSGFSPMFIYPPYMLVQHIWRFALSVRPFSMPIAIDLTFLPLYIYRHNSTAYSMIFVSNNIWFVVYKSLLLVLNFKQIWGKD